MARSSHPENKKKTMAKSTAHRIYTRSYDTQGPSRLFVFSLPFTIRVVFSSLFDLIADLLRLATRSRVKIG